MASQHLPLFYFIRERCHQKLRGTCHLWWKVQGLVVNHDLSGGNFSNGGDLSPEELNKAGGKIKQHNQSTDKGEEPGKQWVWSQLSCSLGWNFESKCLWGFGWYILKFQPHLIHLHRSNILLQYQESPLPMSVVIRSGALLFWSTIPERELICPWRDSRLVLWTSLPDESVCGVPSPMMCLNRWQLL